MLFYHLKIFVKIIIFTNEIRPNIHRLNLLCSQRPRLVSTIKGSFERALPHSLWAIESNLIRRCKYDEENCMRTFSMQNFSGAVNKVLKKNDYLKAIFSFSLVQTATCSPWIPNHFFLFIPRFHPEIFPVHHWLTSH